MQALAFLLHRRFAHVVAGGDQALVSLDVGLRDIDVRMLAPHAFEKDDAARLELAGAHAAEQHLLVECHHQVGQVAAVGDVLGADADAVAAGAGDAARRRADFGGDDLGGPDAVAHPRRNRSERLSAALRAFAGIADDFDDVFAQDDGGAVASFLCRFSFFRGFLGCHVVFRSRCVAWGSADQSPSLGPFRPLARE